MKEWKASEKEAQKMTRDGAISVNMVTGEASHVSDRAPEQDYSPSGDSTALARTALHHLDDRRVRKSQKKKRRNRRKAYREGTAANSRPSSRLQFTEEERAAPELQKAIRKSDKAADKLDAARAAVPKKRVLGTERVFDEASGAGRTRLVFHETDKPASIRQPGPNPLARPLQEVAHAAHAKVREVEQENSGVAAGHLTERGMEKAVGYGNRKLQNWRAERQVKPWRDAAKAEQAAVRANAEALYQKALHDNPQLASGNPISRIWQKKRMQRQYAAAYRASRGAEGAKAATQTAAKSAKKGAEAAKKAGEFIARHKKAFLIIGGIGLVLVLLLGLLQSCSSMFGGGVSNIVASSYLSEDADLLAAEAAYCAKEDELRRYLDTYEQTHDYDEYHYDLDEIEHDPYVLLSILSALHEGTFTIDQVQGDLQMLFDKQYILTETVTTETRYRTETRTDSEGNPYTVQVPYTWPANVHDVTKADELRRPDDWEVIGDSGYLGMEKRDSADPERVTYTAAKRYSQRKKLSAERIADEKLLSSIRCKVEHAFHRIKVQFGYKKVRYRGLAKNTARLTMLASIANMFIGNCFENRTKVSFV